MLKSLIIKCQPSWIRGKKKKLTNEGGDDRECWLKEGESSRGSRARSRDGGDGGASE